MDESYVAVLSTKVEALHEDMVEMKTVMKDVAHALTKLALIDERQSKMLETQGRIFKALENHDDRLDVLEKSDSKQELATDWVYKAAWAGLGVLAMYIAKMLGLL